ncbi:ferrous iron transporter B [Natranaerobius thermophilus]|uniref:Small GTP-binding protein n=1 Tax=Natranaerobius thermophilus (strain ATCC BAA-1301 / DSM 18059 / JW/NM-WN-LF) TaxID=457570 RepID=B2A2W1_NATTJ|nr:ferrous iron transporter B [Natranaerobius thermophilus]ACB86329.1 small GTP-binding protein [Natranaerobius thermophilus JW/NM-WN-LF]
MSDKHSKKDNVLLIGPPNVGKSVIFSNLTGLNISIANYVGTTVEYTVGELQLDSKTANLIDVPGTYTLEATNDAERVAVDMLRGEAKSQSANHCHNEGGLTDVSVDKKPAAVICVIDAYNLESSIYLLLQVLQYKIPTVAVLNRIDLIEERGEQIDISSLSHFLGVPVVPSVAVEKKGTEEIKKTLLASLQAGVSSVDSKSQEKPSPNDNQKAESWNLKNLPDDPQELWSIAEYINEKAKKKKPESQKSKRQLWGDLLVKPWPGLPLSILILATIFGIVVGVGMGIRQYLLLPLFRDLIIPSVVYVVEGLIPEGLVLNVLIGEYGLLVKGLEWPFTLVLPYVISFYAALSVMEDSGYLPRLGGLLDGILNKFGLPGSSVVPLLLGYGCGIPAIMATRSLNSHKERLTVSTLVCLAIPCVAQSGAFIALLAERSIFVLLAVFLFSLLIIFLAGITLDKVLAGSRPYTIMEIPELLVPRGEVVFKKVWLRIKNYIVDGALPMIGIIGIAALLYESGVMTFLGELLSPLVVTWLQLPAEASTPLVLGVFRRELTVIPLIEMDLTTLQLFTGAVVGLFYVPCVAIIAALAREFNFKTAFFILLLTGFLAFFAGGVIARIGGLFV